MLCALIALVAENADQTALLAYVQAPDASFAHVLSEDGNRMEMTSQTWRGTIWRHTITLATPAGSDEPDTAILWVTGGEPNQAELNTAATIGERSQMPVLFLGDIPNQPIWDLTEDDLIAHTFEQFLTTGEPDWPLLLPMVKSTVRAMDAIEAEFGIGRFVVMGASKRGWTTWLTAATGDERIVAIVPMVFDMLNMEAQLARQMELWGRYSPMIGSYTERGLQEVLGTDPGRRLLRTVDPYYYLDRIAVPVMVLLGANDPYWAPDGSTLYWDRIEGHKLLSIVPNTGHDLLESPGYWTRDVGTFCRAMMSGTELAPADTPWVNDRGDLVLKTSRAWDRVILWRAESETLDFSQSEWKGGDTGIQPGVEIARSYTTERNQAFFVDCLSDGFRVSSPIVIMPASD